VSFAQITEEIMHDIDRTQLEQSWQGEGFATQGEDEWLGESYGETFGETYGETQGETYGELYGELQGGSGEMYGETYGGGQGEVYGEVYGEMTSGEAEGVFNEVDEMELAAELLEITNEAELDRFLGKLIRRAGSLAGAALRSPLGRQLGGMLKGVARQALPVAGAALGNLIVPGIGGSIGGTLASSAGTMFGLELEGLSQEDQEFEVARQFVRLAGAATQNAAQMPSNMPPAAAAQNAVAAAARDYAPGLMRGGNVNMNARNTGMGEQMGLRRSGRWVRRGRNIILFGA
jgi:hypothetical protein